MKNVSIVVFSSLVSRHFVESQPNDQAQKLIQCWNLITTTAAAAETATKIYHYLKRCEKISFSFSTICEALQLYGLVETKGEKNDAGLDVVYRILLVWWKFVIPLRKTCLFPLSVSLSLSLSVCVALFSLAISRKRVIFHRTSQSEFTKHTNGFKRNETQEKWHSFMMPMYVEHWILL